MSIVSKFLINLLKYSIIIILAILLTTVISLVSIQDECSFINNFCILIVIFFFIGSIIIFSKVPKSCKISLLLLISFILRLVWIFSVKNFPTSDFKTMYDGAIFILQGETSILKGYSYLSRFPHLIPTTLYMAAIIKFFPVNNLIILKILNVILGSISVYLLYILSKNFIKSDKNRLWVLILGAIFPPFITYSAVLCTENIALPLYLFTLIVFYKSKDNNKLMSFFISGVLLALSNLFRGIGLVFLIAFLIYILLCGEKRKFLNIVSLSIGYFFITIVISGILLGVGLVERPLWNGSEPSFITLLLKGSNFEAKGMWNFDDAEFIEKNLENKNLKELCLKEIKNRLFSKTPRELVNFYFNKVTSQWSFGDCLGTYWAYSGTSVLLKNLTPMFFQILYIGILVLALIGELKGVFGSNALINIILFGCIMLFAIIETQPRYSYIVSWIFIMLSSQGIEYIFNVFDVKKLVPHSCSLDETGILEN